jgi:pilus assembly protein CpaB
LLRREDVSWTELAPGADPTGLLVRGVIADDELFGSALRRPAKSGEMITNEMIVRPGDRGFLASVLAPGNVAVSFNLAQSSVVSGLLQPGDRADVILLQTFGQEPALSPRRASSETILTNVRIVSIDQRLLATPIRVADDPRPAGVGGHDPRAVRTVTVELTQANAERLLLAAELGRLDLVLRSNESASVPARVAPTWADSASSALNPQNRQGINATNEVPLPMLIYRREKVERVDVGGPNLRGGQNQQ